MGFISNSRLLSVGICMSSMSPLVAPYCIVMLLGRPQLVERLFSRMGKSKVLKNAPEALSYKWSTSEVRTLWSGNSIRQLCCPC